jgi:hypothetical protein
MNYVHLNGYYKEYNGVEDTSRFTQIYKVSLSWLTSIAIVPLEP